MARQELQSMLQEEELKDAVVLVFANKQDMGVMGIPAITESLGLHQMRGREWKIQGCCALTGDGLYDGMDWLTKALSKK